MSEDRTCQGCKGTLIAGEPMHMCTVTYLLATGPQVQFEWWCHDCAEDYARDLWNEDEQGPYPVPPRAEVKQGKPS